MKFRIYIKSFNNEKINDVAKKLYKLLVESNCSINGVVSLPTKIRRFCVLRSPHVNKDSREHFEIRLYKKLIDVNTDSLTIFNSLLELEIPSEISTSIELL